GFVADRAIDPGMRVKVWIESRNPKQTSVTFRGDVEVRRCRPAPGGRFWIGAKFLGAGGGRRNARTNVVFNLWYQLAEGTEVRRGTLVDISRGGLAMLVMEPLEVGATLAVCVRGDSGAFRNQEIRALVRVVRCVCVYAGNYEVGTEFLRTKVSPHAAGDAAAPGDLRV
ncbi:MAG: PilZ domain-containing protein, partial [Planctomycetes bacterium]|nr:PilZ domain-containing protein [Planctomycetota bacterium]